MKKDMPTLWQGLITILVSPFVLAVFAFDMTCALLFEIQGPSLYWRNKYFEELNAKKSKESKI